MTCALAPRFRVGQTPDQAARDVLAHDPRELAAGPDTDAVTPVGLRLPPTLRSVLGRTAGWTVVGLGVVLMPLPGPGTLVVVAGLRILVPHHAWAAASYDRVRDRAVAAARAGVATRPRVAASVLGVVWVLALASAYVLEVPVPRAGALGVTVGPSLPFQSTATAVGLVVSALASAGATAYSIVRLRPSAAQPAPERQSPASMV